ncbi:hypothetical protein VTN02DRAFT_3579 [Thermoascus thermophilus]
MAFLESRKRVKPNPPGADSQSRPASLLSYHNDSNVEPARGRSASQKQDRRASWHAKTWPRGPKAAAVTEVARESISVSGHVASDRVASNRPLSTPQKSRSPSARLTTKEGLPPSSRSLPANATTTRINVASDGSASTHGHGATSPLATGSTTHQKGNGDKEVKEIAEDKHPKSTEDTAQHPKEAPDATDDRTPGTDTAPGQPNTEETASYWSSGWLGWLYGRPAPVVQSAPSEPAQEPPASRPTNNDTVLPAKELKEDARPSPKAEPEPESQPEPEPEQAPAEGVTTCAPQRRSWFPLWGGSSAPPQAKEEAEPQPKQKETPIAAEQAGAEEEVDAKPPAKEAENRRAEGPETSKHPPDTPKSTGWLFWSRSTPKETPQDNTQEIQKVESTVPEAPPPKQLKETPEPEMTEVQTASVKRSVKGKKSKDNVEYAAASAAAVQVQEPPTAPTPAKLKTPEASASNQLQKVLPNQVLPSFKDTFALQEQPSLIQTIGRQTIGRLLHYTKEPERKHVYVLRDPPRIRKALAIGVHGYFPAPLIRSVLGQPTGTSVKFSTMAADAIRKWTEDHGFTCEIEKISLEGEGRIAERLDLLWKLLLNWIEDIRKADFILVACHSQGVPVATMLVAKLISFGCLSSSTHVGICAMAGVNMGPFADYKSRWISGSAGELFEFADPNSRVSQDYEEALESVLNFGVRMAYVGSIDDQLVSLESSLFAPATHPYIYRAVFVDGRVHAPSFISHLVGFALKLRNLGFSDHGIIRELSSPLAGSLYGGEGHSRLYDDETVYYLAIQFALETSTVSNATLQIQRPAPTLTPNPYILPFAMRGLLEEDYVRRELYHETMELLRQFDDWKPSSKVLKDVKFRLEGIRSKL